jgi:hypothetical protein
MTDVEQAVTDLWATGIAPDRYPTEYARSQLGLSAVGRKS